MSAHAATALEANRKKLNLQSPFRGPKRPKGENSGFLGPIWPLRWPWDGRDGSTGTQNTSTQCAWVVRIHIMCLGPIRDLYGTPRAPKRARFGLERPFWGPLAAPGGLILAQVPLVGPTGWAASISCARAPYETTTALLGPPKGPVL